MKQSKLRLLIVFLVGAALALSFAPFGYWSLAIVCSAYLFFVWQDAAPREAARLGFWFAAGTFLAGTYWIYHSVHIIGHAPAWLAIALMLCLVSIMGGYTALLGYGLARWFPRRGAIGWLLVLPAAWTLLEWFRGWFLSGFSWLSLGYSQIDTPLAAFAPLGGVYAIGLLAALSAGALVMLLEGTARQRIVAVIVILAIWASGFALWQRSWTQPTGKPLDVAIMQGAIPQDVKWSVAYRDKTLALYRELTLPHLGNDIVLWPEAALPDLPDQMTDYLARIWDDARAQGASLIMGLLHYGDSQNPDFDDVRNGLLSMDEDLQWYDKRRLVPFGEFFPVPSFIRQWLRLSDLPYSDITPGAKRQPALRAAGQKIGATICYEDSYGAEQLAVLKEATLLVNVTNDAWFGDSTAAPQHLEISRMRALEAGRPMMRAANDGISAFIAADGKVQKTLPRFKPGVLLGTVQPRTGLTPYAQAGNYPVVLLCLAALLFGFFRRCR